MKFHRRGINHSYLEVSGRELGFAAVVLAVAVAATVTAFKLSDSGSLVYEGPAVYESHEQTWPEYGCFSVPDLSDDPLCGPIAQVRTGTHAELVNGEEYLVEVHELTNSGYNSGETVYTFIVGSYDL